ncbi:hypothetical protein MIND_00162600 [Mycena indigotica]|uniref:F-box domain-containing protein n=1 Tax=Mycena indigotica TaxID=2126181 RepID=A0A8H6TGU4_9AGAR|nr:uncharacterized protein MIND_00162600 [Mycena indigotica]KAF7316436.1 hypothetical protein MIND_00162600 [Mycena indigotica]
MLNEFPTEILLEIFQYLDPKDPGLFAVSTCNRRLHYLALPVHLAAYDVPLDLTSKELILRHEQLEVLPGLQSALFIRRLSRLSCSFALNSARREYKVEDRDVFFRRIKTLAKFISRLEGLNEVTLSFQDLNFWVVEESLGVLEAWGSAITALLDAVLSSRCKKLSVVGGIFIVHASQFPRWNTATQNIGRRTTVMSDITRKLASHLTLTKHDTHRTIDAGQSQLEILNLHSRLLLLHPVYSWTLAAFKATTPNLTSLSISHVDIPESSWDDVMPSIHVPALQTLELHLKCKIQLLPFIQFLLRHPLIHTLSLGRELLPSEEAVAPRDCLSQLVSLSAPPPFVHFLLAERRISSIFSLRVLANVTSSTPYNVAGINKELACCVAGLEQDLIRMTLAIYVDYNASHWTGFFPDEENSDLYRARFRGLQRPLVDAIQYAQTLEFESTCPSDGFEDLALRWLPPRLRDVSFTKCLKSNADIQSFVSRIEEARPTIRSISVDGVLRNG